MNNLALSVTDGLEDSLRRVSMILVLLWQPVMLIAVLGTVKEIETSPWVLMGLHLTAVLGLLWGIKRPQAIPILVLGLYALAVVNLTSITSIETPLGLASIWLLNLTNLVLPMATCQRRYVALAVVVVVATGIAVSVLASDDLATLAPSISFTGLVTLIAVRVGVLRVRRMASNADQTAAELAIGREEILIEQDLSRSSAEDARVLHDTVVNTLSVIVAGGGALDDLEEIRARCRDDVARVRARFWDRVEPPRASLLSITQGRDGVHLHRSGLSDEEFLRLEPLLGPDSVQALLGAATELIRNVAKHAGVSEAQLDIAKPDSRLVLTISDRGRGFDGAVVAGRGLAESVIARIRDVGGEVGIESAPGWGTTIQLSFPMTPARFSGDSTRTANPRTVESVLEKLRWQGILVWTLGTVGVGVLLELFNRNLQPSLTYVMLAIIAVGTGWGMHVIRYPSKFSSWWLSIVIVSIPISYAVGFAAVGFGVDQVHTYQAIAMSPLVLVPLVRERSLWFLAGIVVYSLAAAVTITLLVLHMGKVYAMEILILSIPVLLLAGIVHWWNEFLTDIVENLEANRSELLQVRAALASREELAQARQYWWAAGLRAALQTLNRIGDGRDDPQTPQVRQRCLAEEQFLRQLTMMSTHLTRLSSWVVNAMVEAQMRRVSLVLRIGDAGDAPDIRSAEILGGLIMQRVVDTAPGGSVNISVFTRNGRSALLLVGPPWKPDQVAIPGDWDFTQQDLGERHLVEVAWPIR